MVIDKKALSKKCVEITRLVDERLQRLRALHREDTVAEVQWLLDTSTFGCNKPQILRLFQLAGLQVFGVNTDSERRVNMLFPAGTVVRFYRRHDKHDYGVDTHAMIAQVTEAFAKENGKIFMRAFKQSLTLGDLLYVYDLYNPVFWPASNIAVEHFVENLPDETILLSQDAVINRIIETPVEVLMEDYKWQVQP